VAIQLSCLDGEPPLPVPIELFPHGLLDGPTAIAIQSCSHATIDLLDEFTVEGDGDLVHRHPGISLGMVLRHTRATWLPAAPSGLRARTDPHAAR
jgi:hypothetical protein